MAPARGVSWVMSCDGEAQAVVGAGADRDRDLDRDVEGGDDEGEERGLSGAWGRGRRSGRCRAGHRVAFVVGVDGDQAGLRVGGALIEGEIGRRCTG